VTDDLATMAGFLGALAVSVLVMVFIIWRDRVKGD
jgi:hypothetical protein